MRHAHLIPIAIFVGTTAILLAQSELVIYKEGTNLYHRPGCPIIRDGVGVVAMTRAQAESRGYKAHSNCDPAQQPAASDQTTRIAKPTAAITVYLDGSQYYHRKECSKLRSSPHPIEARSLESAGTTYWPCPTCKPPVRRKSTESAVPGTGRRGR